MGLRAQVEGLASEGRWQFTHSHRWEARIMGRDADGLINFKIGRSESSFLIVSIISGKIIIRNQLRVRKMSLEERRGDCSLGVQESEVARISGVDDAVVCSIWTHKFTTTQSVWLHFSLTVFISLDTRVE